MSDLRKIQQIYEGGYNGVSIDTPTTSYSPPQERQTKTTYRRPVPTTSPDKVSRSLGYNSGVAAPIEAEEDPATILKMIDQELTSARSQGMDYCVHVLLKLKNFISRA